MWPYSVFKGVLPDIRGELDMAVFSLSWSLAGNPAGADVGYRTA